MLVLQRKSGESIYIEDNIKIIVTKISHDKVRIGIDAPEHISIVRAEVKETKILNQESVKPVGISQLLAIQEKRKGMINSDK